MSRRLIHLFFLCLISIISLAQNKIALPTGKLITLDKATIGLSNVDNTSDVNKPISTPTKDYLDAKSLNIGTSSIPFNRASGALSLSGVSIDGTAKNITDFTINQHLGTSNSPTFWNLSLNNSAYIKNGLGIGTSSLWYSFDMNSLTINGSSGAASVLKYNENTALVLKSLSSISSIIESRNMPLVFGTNNGYGGGQMRLSTFAGGGLGVGNSTLVFPDYPNVSYITVSSSKGSIIDAQVGYVRAFSAYANELGSDVFENRNLPLNFYVNYLYRPSLVPDLSILPTGDVKLGSLTVGALYSNAGILTNTNPSDSTLKNTIRPLNYGLSQVMQLRPKSFYYNSDTLKTTLKYGFIAQEVQNVLPELVHTISKESDKLGIDSEGINVTLVQAVQELKQEVDEKKARIEALEARISVLNKMEERLLALETYMKNQ